MNFISSGIKRTLKKMVRKSGRDKRGVRENDAIINQGCFPAQTCHNNLGPYSSLVVSNQRDEAAESRKGGREEDINQKHPHLSLGCKKSRTPVFNGARIYGDISQEEGSRQGKGDL